MDEVVEKYSTKMLKLPFYRALLVICGLPVFAVLGCCYLFMRLFMANDGQSLRGMKARAARTLRDDGADKRIEDEVLVQLQKKYAFLRKNPSPQKIAAEQKKIAAKEFNELVLAEATQNNNAAFMPYFFDRIKRPPILVFSVIFGFPMYLMILVFSNPYVKYILERLVMMVFVVFGVTFLVFTILYMSPMDPALNILGQHATRDSIAEFNRVYGLDKSYFQQLFEVFRGIVTFNMGNSFVGNEDVIAAIARLFPITLTVTFWSLFISLCIAVPAGIFSAIKPYSTFDYVFMLVALLGLSLPNFWQGLLFILAFSINLKWFPSLYIVGNWKSLIMPVVVLGTGLAASVARMTRSSMLEVIKQDYVTTAKAKGLPYSKVVLRHILGNAMIPIITVVGLQFGGMLGGAAVTERVFNVRGLGSYIVERQFVPDVPIVLAGTVYIALVVSVTNLVVDILYAFLDPRIKSRMKNY